MGLKMDVVVGRGSPEVAAEARIPGVAKRVALAVGRAVVKVAEQGEKVNLNRRRHVLVEGQHSKI